MDFVAFPPPAPCLFGILGGRPVFWGRKQSWTGGGIAFLPGVGQGRVFRVPRQSCHCCLWLLYRRKGVRSGDGSNAHRRTVLGSAGRSANSWVVGHRSTWSQGPTIVSRSDCVCLLTCSPNGDAVEFFERVLRHGRYPEPVGGSFDCCVGRWRCRLSRTVVCP